MRARAEPMRARVLGSGPVIMSFDWNGAGRAFPCTHSGMALVRGALDYCDVLDGAPHPWETALRWLRARDGVLPDPQGRVRVMSLRSNGSLVTAEECAIIARTLDGLTADKARWAPFADASGATAEERQFLVDFASFCASCAKADGCFDGDDANDADRGRPFSEVLRPPAFREDADIGAKILKRLPAAEALATNRFGETLTLSLDGLACLDRIAEKSAGPTEGDEDATRQAALSFACYAIECLRVLHGGTHGGIGEEFRMPAVRLSSGVVVTVAVLSFGFFAEEPSRRPFTLAEYGRAPLISLA